MNTVAGAVLRIVFSLLVSSWVIAGETPTEGEFSAHGFGVVRIENEDRITVPPEQATAVWDFLVSHLVDNTQELKRFDPRFTSHYSVEEFTDTYYDTPDLKLLSRQSGVRHRRRKNLTNPDDRKSGRELMQIKLNNISGNQLERAELKFEIEYPSTMKSKDDGHPLLGIVKPVHREPLKKKLADEGIDPQVMRPLITIHDLRKRIFILRNGKPFMSISHDSVHSEFMWAKCEFVEIEPELNEIAYTEADAPTRVQMAKVGGGITSLLMTRFPDLKRDLTPKYNRAFQSFESKIPLLRWWVKTNMITTGAVVGVALLAVTAFVGLMVFARKAMRSMAFSGGNPVPAEACGTAL